MTAASKSPLGLLAGMIRSIGFAGELRLGKAAGQAIVEQIEAVLAPPPRELPTAVWSEMASCPRDGTVVLLRWGEDHVSPGWWASLTDMDDGAEKDPFPWAFFDGKDGQVFVNHAVDTELGPTHWAHYRPAADAMRNGGGK